MPSEFEIISHLRKFQRKHRGIIGGMGDDCAVIRGRLGFYSLLTVDAFVDKVHFDLQEMSLRDVGKKCAAAALSDIAAMAGRPQGMLVSLGIPLHFGQRKIILFYKGLSSVLKRFGAAIVGGNITRAPVFWVDLVVIGEVEKKVCKFRHGARPGDGIYLTGPLGRAAFRHYRVISTPRLTYGRMLGKMREVTSMIDVSDGLASDLGHILEASKCGARIFYDQIPRARSMVGAIRELPLLVLSGGEDYELLFTASAGAESKLRRFFKIGEITTGRGLQIYDKDGLEIKLKRKGYDHFEDSPL